MLTYCKECRYRVPPEQLTIEEEREIRQHMVDQDGPLPERESSCHRHAPQVELFPTPRGPVALTVWPSMRAESDPSACCGEGERQINVTP